MTSECGQAGDLAGILDMEQPDLVVLGVSVDGINVGEILEAIVRKHFGGKVLVIGQPHSIMVKAVRQIGDEYGIASCPRCRRRSAPRACAPASRSCCRPSRRQARPSMSPRP